MSFLLAGKPGVGGPFIEGTGKGLILETPERKKNDDQCNQYHY